MTCDIAARPIGPVEDVKVACRWMQNCLEKHGKCGKSREGVTKEDPKVSHHLLTRVIDVCTSDGSQAPYLHINQGGVDRYVTLSHCWGNAVTLKTTRETVATHMKQISMLELTKTFHDAIIITRNLGFRYLWIDSLCIVQDDPKDWEVESAMMGHIYRNSIVTISASSSASSNVGFLYPRRSDPKISLSRALSDGSTAVIRLRKRLKEFKETVSSGPLCQRAWAFQERLLSRRILHYADDQVHWECQESCLSEGGRSISGHDRLKSSSILSHIAASPSSAVEPRSLYLDWYETVEAYTRGELTRASDKLPALSGLAGVFSTQTGDRYLAGLWESDIKFGLLWSAARSDAPRLRSPPAYRAPSWSWAALDGHISFPTAEFHPSPPPEAPRATFALHDLDASIHLSGSDPHGAVAAGTIRVTGRLKPVTYTIETESLEYFRSVMPTMRDPLHGEGIGLAWAFFDEAGTHGPLLIFEVCSFGDEQHCLMLQSTGNADDEYRRVGRGFLRRFGRGNWFDDVEMKRITIC